MHPLVSVLITTYNGENYIVETLESIINQTYKNIEIIVVNDGSTDYTKNKLKPYFNKIIYHYQENIGTYGSLNVAYSLASGKYIAIQDHDDISTPDRITKSVYVLEKNPHCCFVYSPAIFIDKQGHEIGKWDIDRKEMNQIATFRDLYINGNFIPHSSILHNKKYIKETFPYNPYLRVCGDFHFTLNQTIRFPIIRISKPLIKIRKGLGNQVSGNKSALFHEEKIVLTTIYKNFKRKISRSIFWKSLSNQFFKEAKYYLDNKQIIKFSKTISMSIICNPFNKETYLLILNRFIYFLFKFLKVKMS
ncbi:MAG: glycosyltransferase family 2 protein [Ignavibacteriales bacterium]|nr:glycosyltransferase family 2 protein [Ignavibacteriales bacterium]MBN2602213.1 glycosyltransferase family 2 protein [Candidatus Neomarinimicrobiota bacterium]